MDDDRLRNELVQRWRQREGRALNWLARDMRLAAAVKRAIDAGYTASPRQTPPQGEQQL